MLQVEMPQLLERLKFKTATEENDVAAPKGWKFRDGTGSI
jgi:hypothetical protein